MLTDSQAKSKNPERRTDTFSISILRKFLEIAHTVPALNVDYVIHTGDMFDIPRVSPDFVGQLVELIKLSGVPWYVVVGNHDMYTDISTISQTMLGLMAKSGVVNILSRENPVILRDTVNGFNVSLQGQEYYQDIDKDQTDYKDYQVEVDPTCAYHILGVHGMLVDKPFMANTAYTLTGSVKSDADIILAGHYHPGFNPIVNGKLHILNPGSMARVTAGPADDRIPQYAFINIDSNGIKYKYMPFRTAKPAADVLDIVGKQAQKLNQTTLANFQSSLQLNINSQALDFPTILQDLANDPNNQIDNLMVTDALALIAKTQISKDDAVPKLDGFIESPDKVYITNVTAKNFMCYADVNVDFCEGLNVITGGSNEGKTTLLRLIDWVQNAEPKGNSIISTWASRVTGSVTYSNGLTITRTRTNSDSGTVTITDLTGNAVAGPFKGVKDNPIDIVNVHQSPSIYFAKDDKRDILYAKQQESAFMVADTPGSRAMTIGRLTGLQNVDATVRTINASNKAITAEVNIKKKQLEDNQSKLAAYDHLDELKQRIIDIEQLKIEIVGLTDEIDELTYLNNRYQSVLIDLDTVKQKSVIVPPTQQEMDELESMARLVIDLENLHSNYVQCNVDLATTTEKLEQSRIRYNLLDKALPSIELLDKEIVDSGRLHETYLDIQHNLLLNTTELEKQKVVYPILEQAIQDMDSIVLQITELTKLSKELDTTKLEYTNTTKEITRLQSVCTSVEEKLSHYDGCECPTCGRTIQGRIQV